MIRRSLGLSFALALAFPLHAEDLTMCGAGVGLPPSPFVASGNNIFNSNSGNVGINTTSPSATLDVNGTVRALNLLVGGGSGTSITNIITGLASGCPEGQALRQVSSSGSAVCVAVGGNGSGTITGVTVSTGLTGGGTSGNIPLGLDFTTLSGFYVNESQANSITSAMIQDGAITASKLAAGVVSTQVIQNNSITSEKIVDLTVINNDIANNTITGSKIVEGGIGTRELADGSVTTPKIADGAVTSAKLAAGVVTSQTIQNNSVTSEKIADLTIINNDIANNTITGTKIVAGGIGSRELADGSVTTPKIADGAVTSSKIAPLSIGVEQIATRSITGGKIALNTIEGNNIALGTIKSDNISNRTILAEDITAGTLTSNEIAARSITGDRIALGTIQGDNLAAGTVKSAQIDNRTIIGEDIALGAVRGSELAANSVTGDKIADRSVGTFDIAIGAIGTAEVNPSMVQLRVQSCPEGQAIRAVNENGSVVCQSALPGNRAFFDYHARNVADPNADGDNNATTTPALTNGIQGRCNGGYAVFSSPGLAPQGTYQVTVWGTGFEGGSTDPFTYELEYLENGAWLSRSLRGANSPDGTAPFSMTFLNGQFSASPTAISIRVPCLNTSPGNTPRLRIFGVTIVPIG